jgi:2-polyprenyl-6-methoxyphenol hydroxylase-like FAD-dependent oxidoreductase
MSGLFAALFLQKIGWQFDVFERSPVELVGRGVGIFASHPELLEALKLCNVETDSLGVVIDRRITIDRSGQVIAEKSQRQILSSWDRLRQLLQAKVDSNHYHFGHVFERAEQNGDGVRVHFADGHWEDADLLVGCDGFRSRVRAQAAPEVQPVYAGYYAWRGAPSESELKPETVKGLFPNYAFFLGDQLQVLGYPIPGSSNDLRPGHRRYNFGWFRIATPAELSEMLVDEKGCQHELSVPQPLVRKDLIAQMRREAEDLLPPPFLDCVNNIDQPFFTPVYDFFSPSMVFGRVVLVGDAASTPRPHIGFGVSKAAAEARALTDALQCHDDVDTALCVYNAIRQPLSERIVLHGRKLGTQLRAGLETEDDRRMSQLLQSPKGILDWIAVPNFLGKQL